MVFVGRVDEAVSATLSSGQNTLGGTTYQESAQAQQAQALRSKTAAPITESGVDAAGDWELETSAATFSRVLQTGTTSNGLAAMSPSVRQATSASANRILNEPSSQQSGNGSTVGGVYGETAQEAAQPEIQIPADSTVTPADLQNPQYDYNQDGVVSLEEAEAGKQIEAGLMNLSIMQGARDIQSMRDQMERQRAANQK
jgi:hypothetical protein